MISIDLNFVLSVDPVCFKGICLHVIEKLTQVLKIVF
jgi:hypothetical protein